MKKNNRQKDVRQSLSPIVCSISRDLHCNFLRIKKHIYSTIQTLPLNFPEPKEEPIF